MPAEVLSYSTNFIKLIKPHGERRVRIRTAPSEINREMDIRLSRSSSAISSGNLDFVQLTGVVDRTFRAQKRHFVDLPLFRDAK